MAPEPNANNAGVPLDVEMRDAAGAAFFQRMMNEAREVNAAAENVE